VLGEGRNNFLLEYNENREEDLPGLMPGEDAWN
jgi:hypothetical protein